MQRANSGRSALDLLRAHSFDVLVTDVDMPDMDGLTLLAHSDVVDALHGVIVLTGRCDYEALEAVERRANVRAVPKPFSPNRIAQAIAELLSLSSVAP